MNSNVNSVVIVGAGQAGCQLADSLRQLGFSGRIDLVGEENSLPYQRPPLSKKFLAGEIPAERLLLRPESFYQKNEIHIRPQTQAVRLDLEKQDVHLSNGEVLHYDRLALCTGAHVFRLQLPGSDLAGVHYLRTVEDVEQIRERLTDVRHVAVIGAGFVGLETAAMLAQLGKSVTVVETQDRVMARAVAPEISGFFQTLHDEHGVRILLGHGVTALEGESGALSGLRLSNGEIVPAELCIIGVGILPNVSLAADAGIHCENGIQVDEFALTSNDRVVAAGDCAEHPNELLQRRLRLESVHNAIEQAKTAAASILDQRKPYRQYPWFWSDQYDVKLQMVGISHGHDQLVFRGDPESRRFSCFYFREGRLHAVDSINRPADHMQARRLLNNQIPITPEQAADPDCNLKDLNP
ncbi:NAD(P)/FAD-dependent oxidoreductase [Gilvimarinus sp. F26214L]|uniref:NAD(P)/FAD-dependent oxidoreductase n=1 Tax=Gilvimarinus sp. DZF01 TaxID=3461371 RepID=UPI0040452AC7